MGFGKLILLKKPSIEVLVIKLIDHAVKKLYSSKYK